MKRRDAVGRPSGRSSLLGHPNAKFFDDNGRELRKRTKPRLLGPLRLYLLSLDGFPWVGGGVNRAHGERDRKSGPCQSALQIVLRIAMTARKIWASQADDSFHLDRGYVHGEQFSGDPGIDNAPIGTRKALVNVPTLKPALIDAGGSLGTNRSRWIADTGETVGRISCRSSRRLCYHLRGQMQQVLSGAGEDCTSFNNLYPRSLTRGRASLELLVGKARQSAQVTGAGASQVAAVSVSQVLTDSRRHDRFQGCGADANPSLEMARAGLEHHTWLMAISAHAGKDMGSGVIQIEENIAGIAMLGIGQQIDVIPLTVACAQKAHHSSTHQLTTIPKPFSWTRLSCGTMNQADEVEIIGHGRELAADSVRGEEESAIEHGLENESEAPRHYNDFSANGNDPLNSVSQPRGALQFHSLLGTQNW